MHIFRISVFWTFSLLFSLPAGAVAQARGGAGVVAGLIVDASSGMALADEETMSQAIHEVYCGIAADHPTPNAKDHAQALALIASLQRQVENHPPA